MATPYATIALLFAHGAPQSAFGSLTPTQLQAACDAANEEADSYFRARYPPAYGSDQILLSWGLDVTKAACRIATYNAISFRGFDPGKGSDVLYLTNRDMSIKWFEGVARQMIHPNVIPFAPQSPCYDAPRIVSQNKARGW